MKLFSSFMLCVALSYLHAQTVAWPEVGKKAPEIHLEKVLNNTGNSQISLSEFKGQKIVILEFWATWCGACLQAMKHLDSLQKKFKNDLIVIPITLEDAATVEKYLQKSKIGLLVGIDADSSCFKTYDPQTVPHSVVIDKKGIIVGITRPEEITPRKIQDLIEGKAVDFKRKKRINKEKIEQEGKEVTSDVIFYVKFRKASEDEPAFFKAYRDKARVTASSITIPMLLQFAYQLPSSKRVVLDVKNASQYSFQNAQKYYFDLVVPEFRKKEIYDIMINILKQSLQIDFNIEKRRMKVKVLTLVDKNKLQPSTSNITEQYFKRPEFNARNVTIDVLARYLENFSPYPVVNETGLTGKYDIQFEWNFADKNSFYDALKELGLRLVPEEREIEVLVIREKSR